MPTSFNLIAHHSVERLAALSAESSAWR